MAPLLVRGRHVITMNARREIVTDGAVLVDGTLVAGVDRFETLRARHPDAAVMGDADAVVTPGFVNAHQHLTGDRLVRSCIPDDLAPGESIFTWVVPVHAGHTADDDDLSARLALAEALANGITTTVEAGTVAHPERVAAAMADVGMRGAIGTWGWDVDDAPFAAPADEVLARQGAVLDRFPAGGLVEGWVTLVGHDLASDDLFCGASALARERGVGMTFHLSPTAADAESFLARTGRRPAVHLAELGVLGPNVLLAHAVHIDDDEIEVVLGSATAVAYCPWAYLRLGQGVTRAGRHLDLWRRGGRLALGCDAENASDALDPLRTAALAAGLAKDMSGDPTGFGAHEALELATIRGAEAIGMGDRIGSLEVGKAADLVVHDTSGPHWQPPATDPVTQLVWASDGRSVRQVLVDGRLVVVDGRCSTVDLADLGRRATEAQRRLLAGAGLDPRPRWPVV